MPSVLQAIADKAAADPSAIAISDSRSTVTYGDLHVAIQATADALTAQCPGNQPLATLLDNSPAWAIVDLALLHLAVCTFRCHFSSVKTKEGMPFPLQAQAICFWHPALPPPRFPWRVSTSR